MEFRWIHVSDFHFTDDDPYERNVVLQALVEQVRWQRQHGFEAHTIFATGDIAHSGQAREYELASTFFDNLLGAAALEKKDLFVVPGNHDVNRRAAAGLNRTLTTEDESVSYFSSDHPQYHFAKFMAFRSWFDRYFDGIRTCPQRSTCHAPELITCGGVRVGVLPMNSALFSVWDDDHGKLWIGRRNLDEMIETLASLGTPDLIVGLLHHPLEWLHDVERTNIKAKLQSTVDFLLRGHLHENDVASIVDPSGGSLHLAAGACYQTRKRPNKALLCTANLETCSLTVQPIRYEDSPTEVWIVDPSLFPSNLDIYYAGRYPILRLQARTRAKTATVQGMSLTQQEPKLADVDQQSAEQSYLRQFTLRHQYLGLGLLARRSLPDLYIEPELEARAATPVRPPLPTQPSVLAEILTEQSHVNPLSYRDLLNEVLKTPESSAVFITGEAGIGKTTLLQMIGLRCAEHALQNERTPGRLPVYVELARFGHHLHLRATSSPGQLHDLAEHIALHLQHEYRPYFPHYTAAQVLYGLETGKYLLLLDALDEIAMPALRLRAMQSIREALDMSLCPVIITMRSATYHQTSAYLGYPYVGYPHKEVRRLTVDQMRHYVMQWFDNQLTTRAHYLLKELQDNERLRQLLSNPLLLCMTVSQLSNEAMGATLDLPSDRVKLYQRFIDHLIKERPVVRRRFEQESDLPLLVTPLKQHAYLCQIAYMMHESALWYAPEAMIRQIIARITPGLDADAAQSHLLYLEEETGMLQRRSLDYYAFSHFTFQEFFTAEYLAHRTRASRSTSVTHLVEEASPGALMDPWWHEVIVIYYALSQDDQLIERLLEDNDNIFATHLLLAVDCLIASSSQPTRERRERVHERLVDLYRTTPYTLLRKGVFAEIVRLGDQTPTLLRFLADELRQTDRERCERAITALGRVGTPEAARVLTHHYRRESFPRELMLHAIMALVATASSDVVPTILDMLGSDQIVATQLISQMLAAERPEYTHLLLSFLTKEPQLPPWLFDLLVSQLGSRHDHAVHAYLFDAFQAARDADDVPRMVQLLGVMEIQDADETTVDHSALIAYARSLLASNNVYLTVAALRFLGRQRDRFSIDHLFDLLLRQDRNPAVHVEILRTLAAIGGANAELIMIEFLKESLPPALQQEGLKLLGQCGQEASLACLVEQLHTVLALGRGNFVVCGVIIQAMAWIHQRLAGAPRPHVCKLVLQYLHRDTDADEAVAEAATFLVLQMGDDEQIAQLLDLVRQRPDLGYALVRYLLAHECPKRARIPVRMLMQEYTYGLAEPYLMGAAFRVRLLLLDGLEEQTEMVTRALDIRSHPALCLEALAFLRLEMVPDTDLLRKVRSLLWSADVLVVERALEVLAEFGTGEDIATIYPLLYRSEYKQIAYDSLFAIAQRDRKLGRPEFRG